MKKILLLSIIFVCNLHLFSQENKTASNFAIITGLKYTPIDYIGGGILGISYNYNKFTFSLRNDVSLSIEKVDTLSYFGISKYRVYNYFDIHYKLNDKFSTSLGYGWISNKNQIHRLNSEYGYNVISAGLSYLLSDKTVLEIKGDIPLVEWSSPIDQNLAFPISLGLKYLLK